MQIQDQTETSVIDRLAEAKQRAGVQDIGVSNERVPSILRRHPKTALFVSYALLFCFAIIAFWPLITSASNWFDHYLEERRNRALAAQIIAENRYPTLVGKAPYHPPRELVETWRGLTVDELGTRLIKWLLLTNWLSANGLHDSKVLFEQREKIEIALVLKYKPEAFATEAERQSLPLPTPVTIKGQVFAAYRDWQTLSTGSGAAELMARYQQLDEALYIERLLREGKLSSLVGNEPRASHIWAEWIPLLFRDQERFRNMYLHGEAFKQWGYTGLTPNGSYGDVRNLQLIAKHRPDVFLDHAERLTVKLTPPYRLANGQVIRTVADWEPLMPAEDGIPSDYEKRYQGHPQLIRERARELLANGKYESLAGHTPQAHHLWQERADEAVQPGSEWLFREWLSDKAWYRVNGWHGSIPKPTIQALADMRVLYAYDRDLFLDAHERTVTPVGYQWGYDPGTSLLFFVFGRKEGVPIRVASDWERYVEKLPYGRLLPEEAPE